MGSRSKANFLGTVLLVLGVGCLAAPGANAQAAYQHRFVDANGVDLTHGDFVMAFVEGSIGADEGELALVRNGVWVGGSLNRNGLQWDGIWLGQTPFAGGGYRWTVYLGSRFEQFGATGTSGTGSSLSGGGSSFEYRTKDGTSISFIDPAGSWQPSSNFCNGTQEYCSLLPSVIRSADGSAVALEWDVWTYCIPDCSYDARIARVSNSFGYSIAFTYASGGTSGLAPAPSSWHQRTAATFHNSAAGAGAQASVSYDYPETGVTEVTDIGGRVWRFAGTHLGITGIRRPGAESDTTTVNYGTGNQVTSVTKEGVTTNYNQTVAGSTATMTVTDALSQQTVVISDTGVGRPTSVTDPLNRTTGYQYDGYARLTRVTKAEQNYTHFTYDARGNAIETRNVAKPSSGLADIVTTASFDTTCANPAKCNKPNSTTDARGNTTDYTYDPTHGEVLTITEPAPTGGAVRPETRFTYTLQNGEYLLTGTSACQTLASCTGTADETKSAISYDSNGNVTGVTSGNGTGTLSATITATYDPMGNISTVDGPLAGPADTTKYRYSAARELVGTIGPDPDGAGSLKHRAVRNSYTNALLTKVEQGTVDDQSDPAWAAFAPAEAIDIGYDEYARVITQKLSNGATAYALTQTSYDALGRPDCSAVRMNSGAFDSLPGACALGAEGAFGPDRISKTIYNPASQLAELHVALGTADAATEATLTHTDNGKLHTLKDAENNLTTYEYDGFDRLKKTRYPVTTQGANSSSTGDFEELSYDPTGNVTNRRLRDAQNIALGYDALNRLTSKNLPGAEWDETLGYDNLGRLTSAVKGPVQHGFTWDALGRQIGETQLYGSVSRQFDLAGRMTRLTWHDGFFVDYQRRVTGELLVVRENGATSGPGLLATYYYDNLGRRTTVVYGNVSSIWYDHDPVSRLSAQTHDLAGTAQDLTQIFAYNPASQIVGLTRSNDLYAWTGHGSGSTVSTADGLNRLSSISGAPPSYDARGNMTADPTSGRPYAYGAQNELRSSGTFGIAYDALLRLADTNVGGGSWKQYYYDGLQIAAAFEPGVGLAQRYVWGDGPDELIAWYEGAGTANRRWAHADERGSIIAVSDGSGAAIAINKYDEFGRPQAGNVGRFQYTGQMWMPEAGLHHYKNRVYAPHLGRFLQTDPIGYAGGMNLYAYVGNDPVNLVDPLGLQEERIVVVGRRPEPSPPSAESVGHAGFAQFQEPGFVGGNLLTLASGPDPHTHNNPPDLVDDTIYVRALRIIRKLMRLGRLGSPVAAATALGGSTCPTCVPDVTFQSEHGARHLEGTNLSAEEVEAAIRADIRSIFRRPTSAGEFWGRVSVGGRTVQYHAFTLPNGAINVGTYYIPKGL